MVLSSLTACSSGGAERGAVAEELDLEPASQGIEKMGDLGLWGVEQDVFERQAVVTPFENTQGLTEWIPIPPVTAATLEVLQKRFSLSARQPFSPAERDGSSSWSPELRRGLLSALGAPIQPDGDVVVKGAPDRAFWWVSKNRGRYQGLVLIIQADTGDVYSAYAPPAGRSSVQHHHVVRKVMSAAIRSSYPFRGQGQEIDLKRRR